MKNTLRRKITAAGILLSMLLMGCRHQTGSTAPSADALPEQSGTAEAAVETAVETGQAAYEAVKEQLSQAGGKLASLAAKAADNIKNEDGSFNLESLKAYGQDLYDSFASVGDAGFGDLEALFETIDNINASAENYVLERNAGLLEPGEIQILAGGNVYADDFSELTEFHEIYSAIQYNYNKDEDGCLRLADKADEVILFSLLKEEDGSITVTDARIAEAGEKEAASLEEMCAELGTSYDDAMEMLLFNRAYDVQSLIDYMNQDPSITGVEYEGKVCTAEELEGIETQRLRELYPEDFEEEPAP